MQRGLPQITRSCKIYKIYLKISMEGFRNYLKIRKVKSTKWVFPKSTKFTKIKQMGRLKIAPKCKKPQTFHQIST